MFALLFYGFSDTPIHGANVHALCGICNRGDICVAKMMKKEAYGDKYVVYSSVFPLLGGVEKWSCWEKR